MSEQGFRAAGYSWRLHCGRGVIEQDLKAAVDRAGAKRAFLVARHPSTAAPTSFDASRRRSATTTPGTPSCIEKDLNI